MKPIFHQIPSNSGNSELGDVSEISKPLGEAWLPVGSRDLSQTVK